MTAAHLMLAASTAASQPSWLWYATRGLGTALLVVLSCTVVLGIITSTRWMGESTPGFVAADLHRNLSLLAIVLLVAHIVTTVLDPFAHITVRDVVVPIGAVYRPIWLGLGVAAMWVMVGVLVTSLLRYRIGARLWRLIHWAAYSSWPLAVFHGLGTGSDARSPWLIGIVVSCVVAVILALFQRLREGPATTLPVRVASAAVAAGVIVAGAGWAFGGPFAPGWSVKAGTPVVSTARTGPIHPGSAGFSDPLIGVVVHSAAGVQISMRDTVDTALTVAVRSANGKTETLPVVTVASGTKVLCTVPASPGSSLYAVCGKTRILITLYGDVSVLQTGGQITGRLDTSGPLN